MRHSIECIAIQYAIGGYNMTQSSRTRRNLLKGGVAAASSIALGPLFAGLTANNANASHYYYKKKGFGPIAPVEDQTTGLKLLSLPKGFSYSSFGWTGDLMSDDTLTPDRHDGMAVVDYNYRTKTSTLIRNHERGPIAGLVPVVGEGGAPVYDTFALPTVVDGLGGGTTAVTYRKGKFTGSEATLGGTLTNCAGGPTPWGSWLTCEEGVVSDPNGIFESTFGVPLLEHGYVYEVPAPRFGPASAKPIVDMGKMDHEAVAVDRRSGIVYLTEDNGPNSGFYRFLPNNSSRKIGALEEGGTLQMLKVKDNENADLTTPERGDKHLVEWVTIDDPNLDPEFLVSPGEGFPPVAGDGRSGPYLQGEALGGAKFLRGEGCWYHRGVIYMVDTSGGAAGEGVIWAYVPFRRKWKGIEGKLIALFVSPGQETANNPDNITISPRGGILFCEDGGSFTNPEGNTVGTRLVSVDFAGRAEVFAENNVIIDSQIPDKPLIAPNDYRGSEFAGACFDPTGRTLFVNIQTPGITFAIDGPWWKGGL